MPQCPDCEVELVKTPNKMEGKIIFECPSCEDEFLE